MAYYHVLKRKAVSQRVRELSCSQKNRQRVLPPLIAQRTRITSSFIYTHRIQPKFLVPIAAATLRPPQGLQNKNPLPQGPPADVLSEKLQDYSW